MLRVFKQRHITIRVSEHLELLWLVKRQMETCRLLNKPIKNTDLARQRCTELRNMTHTCTSMVQMDCFKVRRINKNVLNTLKIQSGT